MYWNMRFVNQPSKNDGEDWYTLREVYYNDDDTLIGHAEPCLGSETSEGVHEVVGYITEAAARPFLHENDFKEGETT